MNKGINMPTDGHVFNACREVVNISYSVWVLGLEVGRVREVFVLSLFYLFFLGFGIV